MALHKEKNNRFRFAGLAALTAASAAATSTTLKALRPSERVPQVDALAAPPTGGGEWPFVSVIVPVRNEERNLPRLLPSLLSQHYANYEVIVVDDQSTDSTPRILAEWAERDCRLTVVHGKPLPPGGSWKGKPHAMCQGAEHAKGDWLLFTDADTEHQPLSIGSSAAFAMEQSIDLLSIAPCPEIVTPSERLLMPVAYEGIFILYPTYKVNDPNSKDALANGQYLFIRRQVYDAVGGVERVRNKIAEDLEFAQVVKDEGYRLFIADGRDLMTVRMYTNFKEVWEGWSKNVVLSFEGRPGKAALSALGTFGLTFLPLLMANWTRTSWRKAGRTGMRADRVAATWVSALALWNIGLPLAYRRRVDRMLGLPPGWTLTQPIGTAIFGLIMLNSILRLLTGRGVTWKGRTYSG